MLTIVTFMTAFGSANWLLVGLYRDEPRLDGYLRLRTDAS